MTAILKPDDLETHRSRVVDWALKDELSEPWRLFCSPKTKRRRTCGIGSLVPPPLGAVRQQGVLHDLASMDINLEDPHATTRTLAGKSLRVAVLFTVSCLTCSVEATEDDITTEVSDSEIVLSIHNPDLVRIPDYSNHCFVVNNSALYCHVLKKGDAVGYSEYIWTNRTDQVEASYEGGVYLLFSNGVGLHFERAPLTVENVITRMEETLNLLETPSFAPSLLLYPPEEELEHIRRRRDARRRSGFTRRWYLRRPEMIEQDDEKRIPPNMHPNPSEAKGLPEEMK